MKEFGGYLPIEMEQREEYYMSCRDYDVICYNSGRSAIYEAFYDSRAEVMWLPVYLCDSIHKLFDYFDESVKYYNIDSDFMPVNVNLKDNEILLYTNYYGIQTQGNLNSILKQYVHVIFDNTHAFYNQPVKGTYNVYSCRKFFGVPDGGYLISDSFIHNSRILEKSCSYTTALYLLKAHDTSTNEAYRDSIINEERITNEGVRSMSVLTHKILGGIDYEYCSKKRTENFGELCRCLNELNEISLPSPELCKNIGLSPVCYPFLKRSEGLRQYLVANRIYVPQWWKAVTDNPLANEREKYLSQYLLPLPIDQRYSACDMQHIAEVITQYLNINL